MDIQTETFLSEDLKEVGSHQKGLTTLNWEIPVTVVKSLFQGLTTAFVDSLNLGDAFPSRHAT